MHALYSSSCRPPAVARLKLYWYVKEQVVMHITIITAKVLTDAGQVLKK